MVEIFPVFLEIRASVPFSRIPGNHVVHRTALPATEIREVSMSSKQKYQKGITALYVSLFLAGMSVSACSDEEGALPDSGENDSFHKTAASEDATGILPENYSLDPFRPRSEKRSGAAPDTNADSGTGIPAPAASAPAALSKNSGLVRTAENSSGKKSWTIMVYMSGDNNLEGQSFQEILEMEKALPDGVEIILLHDRSPKFSTDFGDLQGARIYRIRKTSASYDMEQYYLTGNRALLPPSLSSEVIRELGDVNMSDPRNLEDFVRFVVENYPAERYALVGWDHGNGWYGLMGDDTSGDYMTIREYTEAAARAASYLPRKKFDLVLFEMCLMGQLDVLYETRKITDFAVASAPSIPAFGSDYISILPLFTGDVKTEDLGREIVKRNLAFFNRHNAVSDLASFSFYDLRQLDEVISGMQTLTAGLRKHVAADSLKLTRSTIDALHYESSGFDEIHRGLTTPSSVDIFDWLDVIDRTFSDLRKETGELRKALLKLVVHTESTQGFEYAKGLSVFLPLTETNMPTPENPYPAVWGLKHERNYPQTEFAIKSGMKDYLETLFREQKNIKIPAPVFSNTEIGRVRTEAGKQELVIEKENTITPLSQYSLSFDITGNQILWIRFMQLVSDSANPGKRYVSFLQNILDLKRHTPEDINDPRKFMPVFQDGTSSLVREIPGQGYELSDGMKSVSVTVNHSSLNQNEIEITGLYRDQCTGGDVIAALVVDSNTKMGSQLYDEHRHRLIPCSQDAEFKPHYGYLDESGKFHPQVQEAIKLVNAKLILANLPDDVHVQYSLSSENISGATGRTITSGDHIIKNNPEQLRLMNNAKIGLQSIADSYAVGQFASNMESNLDLLPTRGIISFRPDGFSVKGLSLPSWNTSSGEQGILNLTPNLNVPLAPAILETFDSNGRVDMIFRNASSFQVFMDQDDSGHKIFYLIAQGTGDRFALFPLRDINEDSLQGSWIGENQFWSFNSGKVTFSYSGTRVPRNTGTHNGSYTLKDNEITARGLPDSKYYIIIDRLHEKLYLMSESKVQAIVEKAVQDGSMSLREFRSRVQGKWLHRDAAGSATALEISPAGRSGLLRFRFSAAGKNSEAVGAPESDRILMSYDNGARMSTGYRYGKNGNTETLTLIFENGGEYTFQKQ